MEQRTQQTHHQSRLGEQITLLTGADDWHTAASAGVRAMRLSDGPVGVRGGSFDSVRRGALLPNPAALASTWDRALIREAGQLLGREARDAGVDWLLAPTLNLPRSPLGGRTFECYSEDPLLTAEVGLALILGIQSTGVAATAKHFVANESETERLSYSVRVSERALRERYLLPFEVAVTEGRVAAIMASYNALNGTLATENRWLLHDLLRTEWGFTGAVVSDWGAARTTADTILAGLDLVMPATESPWGDQLRAAVRSGEVPVAAIERAAGRIAEIARRTDPALEPAALADQDDEAAKSLLRRAATLGSVLLANDGILPLVHIDADADAVRRIALIGPGARELCLQGGGSALILPKHHTGLIEALRPHFGPGTEFVLADGVRIGRTLPLLDPSRIEEALSLEFADAQGTPISRRQLDVSHAVLESAPAGTVAVTMRARVRFAETGTHQLAVRGDGYFALSVDGTVTELTNATPDRDPLSPIVEPAECVFEVTEGTHDIALTLRWDQSADWHVLGLGHLAPESDEKTRIAQAAELAGSADIAIVVVGTTAEYETEGVDRTTLALPGGQNELVTQICLANPNTIVVVNTGSPVLLPWAKLPRALLWAGFPGQEGGEAIADILVGDAEPGGRLAMTLPSTQADLPSIIPDDGVLEFIEEDRIGYRAATDSVYPFGHGLGYTQWAFEAVKVQRGPDGEVAVSVTVSNVGQRAGREVVQAYLRDEDGLRRLVGFGAIELGAGETGITVVQVRARSLRLWHLDGWRQRTGELTLDIGSSSSALPLSVTLECSQTTRTELGTG